METAFGCRGQTHDPHCVPLPVGKSSLGLPSGGPSALFTAGTWVGPAVKEIEGRVPSRQHVVPVQTRGRFAFLPALTLLTCAA